LGQGGAPRVRFVQMTPPARAAAVPVPITPPPVPVVTPPPKPVAPAAVVAQTAPSVAAPSAAVQGAGDGLGKTGGAGAGPGSGGGVGSGEGPGKGSGTGPGTGGGNATNYPPTPKQFFLPPLPPPSSLHGFTLVAWFDVDSTGKSKLLRFTESRDGGYNKLLRETLLAVRFRPAVRPDGVPVRDTVDIRYTF
jgi:protein TonB